MILLPAYTNFCCTTCNPVIQKAIYNSTFYPNLLIMLAAFIVLAILVIMLTFITKKRHESSSKLNPGLSMPAPAPLFTAALVLGIGLGGFVDGILFHQLLQWHEMLSHKIPPITLVAKSVNMFWDGIFHLFCLLVVVAGIYLLWKVSSKKDSDLSGNLLIGGLLSGWGLFNLVEGIIDHHLVQLHNVREFSSNTALWNYGFLVFSLLMLIAGFLIKAKSFYLHGKS